MRFYFKTNSDRIEIDTNNKTYKTGYMCKYYVHYITIKQYEFNNILEELKQNNFTEYEAK